MIMLRELRILWRKALYNDRNKPVFTKWKQSLLAITFALALTALLILIKGQNPLVIFATVIAGATRNADSLAKTLLYYAMFILAGLAVIIAFRSGLFNIGVAGQMLTAGVVMMIAAVQTGWPWPLLLLIGITAGAITAALVGLLKAYFNIHEVVSSILINWICFYVSQYLLQPAQSWTDAYGTTRTLAEGSRLQIGTSLVLPALIVAVTLLVGAVVLFQTTKWGYALKAVGVNQDAARYSGIRVTRYLALAMALSGGVAGALAGVNYLGRFGSMSQATGPSLPAIGFQGISVALIAFKSFLGLIPAALFWALITSGANYVSIVYPAIPSEVLALMNGFIIYMIAISVVFIRFRPLRLFWQLYCRLTSGAIRSERVHRRIARATQKTICNQAKMLIKAGAYTGTTEQLEALYNRKKQLQKAFQSLLYQLRMHRIKTFKFAYPKHRNRQPGQGHKDETYRDKKATLLAKHYKQIDHIDEQIKAVRQTGREQLLLQNRARYRNGLAIVQNEYERRIKTLQARITKDSIVGRWRAHYSARKHRAELVAQQYNLLRIELKTNLKAAPSPASRAALKSKFRQQVVALEANLKRAAN